MAAILLGSVAPDLQIVLFYAVEKLVFDTPDAVIWSTRYFEVHEWFDWMNSIPLAALGVAICHWRGWILARGFFAGLLLHSGLDLPVHNDDAHRHFLPLSTWRFHSPLSYWDVEHYAVGVAAVELALTAIASRILWLRNGGWKTLLGLGITWGIYGVIGIAIGVWQTASTG